MFKKTITYVDYEGTERTEDFYFNLSSAEIAEKELRTVGGYGEQLLRIANSQDREAIVNEWKSFILGAYGVKSEDGRRFIKSPELAEAFTQTPAYDQLFLELLSDADFAAEFVNGVMASVNKAADSGQLTLEKAKELLEEKRKQQEAGK